MTELSLSGRVAVVTGVSRHQGIGFAIATQLAGMGANLFVQHYRPHDEQQPWGGDDTAAVVDDLRGSLAGDAAIGDIGLDLGTPEGPDALIDAARASFGHLDILVCNHARSGGDGRLAEQTADMLDGHWQVNARSTLLATRAFADQHDGRDGGRVIWMTSGQQEGSMPAEIAYAASKAALAGVTRSVADDLIDRGIVLNTINPGPVNTGFLDSATTDRPGELDAILGRFPTGRFGEPDDPARLIAWLVSDAGRSVVGQTLSSESGFRR